MQIREALIVDLPRILELLKYLDSENILSLKEAQAIWDRIKKYPFYKVFVAVNDDEEIVGTFSMIICDNLGHGGARFSVVDGFVVDPGYRRRGIGTEMMQNAMRIAKKNGCYKLMLSSNMERTDAHEFYRKVGMKQHGYSFEVNI